jgi:hypothetical protein
VPALADQRTAEQRTEMDDEELNKRLPSHKGVQQDPASMVASVASAASVGPLPASAGTPPHVDVPKNLAAPANWY